MEPVTFLEAQADVGTGDPGQGARRPPADAAVVARRLHTRVRETMVELRSQARLMAETPSLAEHVRDVIVIASSSRGGSSLLAEMLRAVPGLAHFPGEINPALRLANLLYPCAPSGSDAIEPAHLTPTALQVVDEELSAQCGAPCALLDAPASREHFALQLACRLAMQWPDDTFGLGEVRRWMEEALERTGWRTGGPLDGVEFHVAFLEAARRAHPQVDASRYDLPEERVGRPPDGAGPPGAALIEEPPFVAVLPWRSLDAGSLARSPLVIKTPANVYRLDVLRNLFPRATLRILHLVRNAGASVNGLFDGWRHPGFFAHHVDVPLDIRGYTELGAWARHEWKFDLPPGWRAHVASPLPEVCAFQWRSAHQAVLRWLDAHPEVDRCSVRFEDLVGPTARRRRAWEALEEWLGVPARDALGPLIERGLPPVMATQRPSPRRWAARAAILEPVLAAVGIRETMEALGYEPDPRYWD